MKLPFKFKKTSMEEKTHSQTIDNPALLISGKMELDCNLPATYNTYREIRKDPTVALARELAIAPIMCGNWTIEGDASKVKKDFIADQFLDIRDQIMEEVLLYGHVDFGWMGFEKVFVHDSGKIKLKKLKPLLHDITTILVDKSNGAFNGFYQERDNVTVPVEKSFLVSFRVEGTKWYGQGLLENVRRIYNRWMTADDGATRYDKKVAGSHFLVSYPRGQNTVNGVKKDNSEIAKDLLDALESSGSAVIPHPKEDIPGDSSIEFKRWIVDILEDKVARQPTFVQRLKYLDTLKSRAILLPERTILEGVHGTKAEAGEHLDLALHMMYFLDRRITRYVNWYVVDHLLALNWGDKWRGKVKLVPSPLADKTQIYLKDLYIQMLKDPSGFAQEYETIDTSGLKRKLEIPQIKEKESKKQKIMIPRNRLIDDKEKMPIPTDGGRDNVGKQNGDFA